MRCGSLTAIAERAPTSRLMPRKNCANIPWSLRARSSACVRKVAACFASTLPAGSSSGAFTAARPTELERIGFHAHPANPRCGVRSHRLRNRLPRLFAIVRGSSSLHDAVHPRLELIPHRHSHADAGQFREIGVFDAVHGNPANRKAINHRLRPIRFL